MKKIFWIIIGVILLINVCYGASSSFEYMLEVMEIPIKNQNGLLINEEIFQKYQLFVYGSPEIIKTGQRWKNVSEGKWTKDGIKGEYWILGENFHGKEVHNPEFPYDMDLGINPRYWPYVEIAGGQESWEELEKTSTKKQIDYMKTQVLSRNNTTYDFTAPEIGYRKTRVENVATWKTNGIIEVRKKDANGIYWSATFYIKPMAADASLEANLKMPGGVFYHFDENHQQVEIEIDYGAMVNNLSGYAEKEDIKTLRTELWINEEQVDVSIKNKETSTQNMFNLVIDRESLEGKKQIQIPVKCIAMLETAFQNDLPLYDEKEEILTISLNEIVEEQEETETEKIKVHNEHVVNNVNEIPVIRSIRIKRVSTDARGNEKYVDLLKARRTNTRFISAGQVLYLEVTVANTDRVTLEIAGDSSIITCDELTKKFEWEEPKSRGIKTNYSNLNQLEKSYQMPRELSLKEEGEETKVFSITYVVPYQTKQTLHSWNTLRKQNQNAFEISETDLFKPISQPYQFVIKARSNGGVTTKRELIDVFEAWNTIYNRDLSEYVY